jgi:hypothetical protein
LEIAGPSKGAGPTSRDLAQLVIGAWSMNDPHECHRKAEALATLAEMFPEDAERYRAKEEYWRQLEVEARAPKRAGAAPVTR